MGKAILKILQEENIAAACYTRREFLNRKECGNATSTIGELNECHKIRQALEGCDSIIHCAGLIDFSYKNYKQLHFVHVEALKNLIEASEGLRIKRLLYVSSHWTIGFSLSRDVICSEACHLSPDNRIYNAYQKVKLEGEDYLKQKSDLGFEYVVVNPTQIWGIENKNKLFCDFIKKGKSGRVFIVPCGGVNMVDVKDVARGVLLALKRGKSGERYILGGENITFKSMLSKFLQIRGQRGFIIELPCMPVRLLGKTAHWLSAKFLPSLAGKYYFLNSISTYKYYSSTKAETELGYTNTADAGSIIKEAIYCPF